MTFASTACLSGGHASLEDLLDTYRDAGLRAVELGFSPPPAGPFPECLRARDQQFVIHNYFPAPRDSFLLNLAAQDRDTRDRSIALCKSAIDLSALCGAPFYSVHGGFCADITPSSLGGRLQSTVLWDREQCYRTYVQTFCELSQYASDRGVDLLVEPNVVPSTNLTAGRNQLALLSDTPELLRFVQDTDGAGILLDTGHLRVTAQTLGFDRNEFVNALLPFIKAVHVHDNDGITDSHTPMADGSWVLPMLRCLAARGVPMIVEARFSSVSDLASHVSWLNGTLGESM